MSPYFKVKYYRSLLNSSKNIIFVPTFVLVIPDIDNILTHIENFINKTMAFLGDLCAILLFFVTLVCGMTSSTLALSCVSLIQFKYLSVKTFHSKIVS